MHYCKAKILVNKLQFIRTKHYKHIFNILSTTKYLPVLVCYSMLFLEIYYRFTPLLNETVHLETQEAEDCTE